MSYSNPRTPTLCVRQAGTVVTEVEMLHIREGLRQGLSARRAAELHERIGWAVIERARPRTVPARTTGEHRDKSGEPVRHVLLTLGEHAVATLTSPLPTTAPPGFVPF